MAYSTIPEAKRRMLTILQAAAGLSGVYMQRGLLVDPPPQYERVYVDNAVEITRQWAMLGRPGIATPSRLDESYTVRIPVEVYQDGNDQAACEDRMWELVAVIELALLADPTLGGVLNANTDRAAPLKPGEIEAQNNFAYNDGWMAQTVVRIDCAARI